MIAALLIAIVLLFIAPVIKFKKREKEIRKNQATILKIVADDAFLDREIHDSEESGRHIRINTSVFHENLRDVYALSIMLSDANVTLIHNGEHIPIFKQAVEKVANEPRRPS